MKTKDLENILTKNEGNDLDSLLDKIDERDFVSYLNSLIRASALSNAKIISSSNIERTYYYQILNGTRTPGKDKVIALALVLKLDLEKTNRLLKLSKNASLYPKIKRDAVIMYCLGNKYDVYKTNLYLLDHGYEVLK